MVYNILRFVAVLSLIGLLFGCGSLDFTPGQAYFEPSPLKKDGSPVNKNKNKQHYIVPHKIVQETDIESERV